MNESPNEPRSHGRGNMVMHTTLTSPFGRKVRMVAIEKGIVARIEWRLIDVPVSDRVRSLNPLGKIPALELADGSVLIDSPVIADYLDSLVLSPVLLPPHGAARWDALKLQAIADGIADAAVLRRFEMQRPNDLRYDRWAGHLQAAMDASADALENLASSSALSLSPTIGTLALAATLGYLDFRFPHENWRATRPHLAAWMHEFSQRDCVRATEPVEV